MGLSGLKPVQRTSGPKLLDDFAAVGPIMLLESPFVATGIPYVCRLLQAADG